jgi:cyclophilin family peptidyl-prolyl cis-trans isomerase
MGNLAGMTSRRLLLLLLTTTSLPACAGTLPAPASPAPGMPLEATTLAPHAAAWERLLAAEDARAQTPAQMATLVEGLASPVPALRSMAVRALGRLERADAAVHVAPMLQDPDPVVRAHAANALAQAQRGGEVSRARLEAALEAEQDAAAAGVMAEALGRWRHADATDGARTLSILLGQLPSEARSGAVRGLYFLARQPAARPAFSGADLGALREVIVQNAAVDTASVRLRTVAVATLVAAGAADESIARTAATDGAWAVRREAVLATAGLPDTAAVQRGLAPALGDRAFQVRYEALRGYGRRLAASHGCAPVRQALRDADAHVRLLALELMAACRDVGAADVEHLESVARTTHAAQWHEGARALVSLATLAPERARALLGASPAAGLPGYALPTDPFARTYAARAFGVLRDTAALRALAFDSEYIVRTAAVQALAPLAARSADDVYVAQLAADDSQLLQAAAAALEGSTTPGAAAALLDALDRMTAMQSQTSRDARRSLLRRAGELGSAAMVDRVTPYVRDFDPVIAALAADVIGEWTGNRPAPQPSAYPPLPLPTFAEAAALADARVAIEMESGGVVVLRLLPFESPTNAARLARLAARGYYDGLTLHRVVPNFVVQGGSPHANEYTGDGPFTRDELGLAGNWRGTVGLSTRGRDTGDGQLFINLIDNVRLDHDYTIFAEVVAGMDVVDGMLEGARIRRITVQPR